MRHFKSNTRLQAFTLVEMLVVLAILAVLFALATSAVVAFYGVGKTSVTTTTLNLVKSLLNRQWTDFADKANREPISTDAQTYVNGYAGSDDLAPLRARVLYVKVRQRFAFPTDFDEVFPAPGLPPGTANVPAPFVNPKYVQYLTKLGFTSSNYSTWPALTRNPPVASTTPEYRKAARSAVCLKMILELGPGGGGTSNDELSGLSKVIEMNGATEVLGLVDGFNMPLVFSRNPTGFTNLQSEPAPFDSADPRNLLQASAAPAVGHALPLTHKIRPVVASSGADMKLGLNPVTFAPVNPNDAADNKYTTDN